MYTEIPKLRLSMDEKDRAPGWVACQKEENGQLVPCKPVIKCQCGQFCGIGLHHVHKDGTVTASFLHGKADFTHNGRQYQGDPNGCEWHVWLKLQDYDGPEFRPEP